MKAEFKPVDGYMHEEIFIEEFEIKENEIYIDGVWVDSVLRNEPIEYIKISKK